MVGSFRHRQALKGFADENFFPWIDICSIQINKLNKFQTLGSNVKPKRPPSILFLALLDTSKIRSISFTPVACITSDTFSVSLVRRREGKLEAGRINLYPPWLEASEESQAQDRGRRSSLASRLPSLA